MINRTQSLAILKSLCSVPTAPFVETPVAEYIAQFVKDRPGLSLAKDKSGNFLVSIKSKSRKPRWVFTAHMDHPGFVAMEMIDRKTLRAAFRGWVQDDYVKGAKV